MFGASVSTSIKRGGWAQWLQTALSELKFFVLTTSEISVSFKLKGLSAYLKSELIKYKTELIQYQVITPEDMETFLP